MNPVSSKTKTLLYVHRALENIANALQYPQTELYQLIIGTNDYCNEVEDIVDSPVFEDCKLKIRGVWFTYNGNSITDSSKKDIETDNRTRLSRETSEIKKSPLYAVRRQAVLRAMDYFRVPASIRDIPEPSAERLGGRLSRKMMWKRLSRRYLICNVLMGNTFCGRNKEQEERLTIPKLLGTKI